MKYFLFNHAGSCNHGCEAIIRGTKNIIERVDDDCKIILSSEDPDSDRVIDDITIVSSALRPLTKTEHIIAAINYRLKKSEDYALKKMYSDIIAQASDCDICLSVGGDTYCYGDNRGVQVMTQELKKLGKKVYLWGASIGNEDLTPEKEKNLSVFDAIFTREPITYELLKDKNVNKNIFQNSDPAFCMEREEVELPHGFEKHSTIGFNVSPLIEKGNPQIGKVSEEFINYIISNTQFSVLLVPHVIQKNNNDYEYMLPLFEKYKDTGRIAILPPDMNAKQYKGYISKTRFFIGARTHATIAAYSSGVPTMVLGYSVKSKGIAKDIFGDERFVLDSAKLNSANELIAQFNQLCECEDDIKAILKEQIPRKIASSFRLGKELIKL